MSKPLLLRRDSVLTQNSNNLITSGKLFDCLQKIPISQGGTGATTIDGALINLSSPKIYHGSNIPDNSLGKDGDIYIIVR